MTGLSFIDADGNVLLSAGTINDQVGAAYSEIKYNLDDDERIIGIRSGARHGDPFTSHYDVQFLLGSRSI